MYGCLLNCNCNLGGVFITIKSNKTFLQSQSIRLYPDNILGKIDNLKKYWFTMRFRVLSLCLASTVRVAMQHFV